MKRLTGKIACSKLRAPNTAGTPRTTPTKRRNEEASMKLKCSYSNASIKEKEKRNFDAQPVKTPLFDAQLFDES